MAASFQEAWLLKTATRTFKEVIGQGGFGAVYKDILADERVVAAKKLGDVVQGEEEFWAEVSTIGKINHMNLARMWGFCSDREHNYFCIQVALDHNYSHRLLESILAIKNSYHDQHHLEKIMPITNHMDSGADYANHKSHGLT